MMTRAQLRSILQERRVDPDSYSLEETLPNDKFVLYDEGGGRWSVYYSERGVRYGQKFFDNEDAACRYLLKELEKRT